MKVPVTFLVIFMSGYLLGKLKMLYRMLLLKQDNAAIKKVRESERIEGFIEGMKDGQDYYDK